MLFVNRDILHKQFDLVSQACLSGFGYMGQHLWQMATYYEIPNMKRDGTKCNSNYKQQTGGK